MRYSTLFGLLACLLFTTIQVNAQGNEEDAFFIKKIYNTALTEGKAYDWLDFITNEIGGRLSGSPEGLAAVEYGRQVMTDLKMDKVTLQECMVPHWSRGETEIARVVNSPSRGSFDLSVVALGNSEGTGPKGLTAEVIEVQGLNDLEELGRSKIEGKIVFYNRPMDPTQINTMAAYGGAVDQRVFGASRAAKYGGVAAIVRSMTTKLDDVPHTGTQAYEDDTPYKAPSFAISTEGANLLSQMLKNEPVRVYLRNTSTMLSDKKSYNVIGEIKGSQYPNEIILVGGHLDSWDIGTGAHDDGAGCVHSMDVINIMNTIGYKPKRTIRCVLFQNEENGLKGARKYWAASNEAKEYHVLALESDRGGFTPRGFTCDADETVFKKKFKQVVDWLPLLGAYGLDVQKGGSGADIGGLKSQKGLLCGFLPDSQRYFDFHHARTDLFSTVNKRELQLGSAAMTSLVYLVDKYGLD